MENASVLFGFFSAVIYVIVSVDFFCTIALNCGRSGMAPDFKKWPPCLTLLAVHLEVAFNHA